MTTSIDKETAKKMACDYFGDYVSEEPIVMSCDETTNGYIASDGVPGGSHLIFIEKSGKIVDMGYDRFEPPDF